MRVYLIRKWDAERTVCGVFDGEVMYRCTVCKKEHVWAVQAKG